MVIGADFTPFDPAIFYSENEEGWTPPKVGGDLRAVINGDGYFHMGVLLFPGLRKAVMGSGGEANVEDGRALFHI
ncbi:MAG TPA: hypothetical protein VJ549_03925 [Geothrix sp.]|nr:hypothetical protein [Geothrix sp.]